MFCAIIDMGSPFNLWALPRSVWTTTLRWRNTNNRLRLRGWEETDRPYSQPGPVGPTPCPAPPGLWLCDISTTLTHGTWRALPLLDCLALDTEQTAATLCAQSSCWQLVLPTAAALSLLACGAEARSSLFPQGQTEKHKQVTIKKLGKSTWPTKLWLGGRGNQYRRATGCPEALSFPSYTQYGL